MSNRFGTDATFYYVPGDTLGTNGTTLALLNQDMPNYPFEAYEINDRKSLLSRTGRKWVYQNYNLQGYKFNWSNASQLTRDELRAMWDSLPVFTFKSAGITWGTFRFSDDTWQDQEVGYDLFDVSLSIEEQA